MTVSYTPNIKMAIPGVGDRSWNVQVVADWQLLDAQNAIGSLAVTTHEQPSTSLLVDVAAGTFVNQANVVTTYAGVLSFALTTAATNYVYLTNAGVLTKSTVGWPAAGTLYVPLAVVIAAGTTLTSIADARAPFRAVGAGFLPLAGGTLADPADIVLGTTTGTKIGTASSQKIGFLGATPAIQQTGGALTATGTWTATEEGMLQKAYNALRTFGLLS